MSQINSFGNISSSGTGPILSLTGNDLIPVFPDGAGNINVVGNTLGTVRTTGTTNTLTIFDNGTLLATATTTDATVTTIATITLATGQGVSMEVLAIGASSTQSEGVFAQGEAAFRKPAALPIAIFGPVVNVQTDSGAGPTVGFSVSGGNPVVTVQGSALATYTWTAYIRYVITPNPII